MNDPRDYFFLPNKFSQKAAHESIPAINGHVGMTFPLQPPAQMVLPADIRYPRLWRAPCSTSKNSITRTPQAIKNMVADRLKTLLKSPGLWDNLLKYADYTNPNLVANVNNAPVNVPPLAHTQAQRPQTWHYENHQRHWPLDYGPHSQVAKAAWSLHGWFLSHGSRPTSRSVECEPAVQDITTLEITSPVNGLLMVSRSEIHV